MVRRATAPPACARTILRWVSTFPGPDFRYSDLLPLAPDRTPYRLLTSEGVRTSEVDGQTFLHVEPSAIQALTAEAMHDISHFLRPAHDQPGDDVQYLHAPSSETPSIGEAAPDRSRWRRR